MNEIVGVLEIIGTIAFAVSGSIVALGAGLDLFGVVFVGCITAVGGGILRDLLIGITPPTIFMNFPIFLIALLTGVAVFSVFYLKRENFGAMKAKIETINNIFDAVGLAAFTVTGAEIGCINGFSQNGFVVIVLGMLTGIGGGILRDVLTDTTPYVFKKHVYALASILGSALYFVLKNRALSPAVISVAPMFLVFVIRMLATKYRWSLPKISAASADSETDCNLVVQNVCDSSRQSEII